MRDLKLVFSERGVDIAPEEFVEGFDATTQAACVCLITTRGSARNDTEKGTRLLQRLLTSGALSAAARQHQLAFAALDVQFYLNALPSSRTSERILNLALQEEDFAAGLLRLNMVVEGEAGSAVGTYLTANLLA